MKRRNKVFKFEPDLDKAYRQLFGRNSPAGCSVCGEDNPILLDIHEANNNNDFKVLYRRCCCNLSEKYNKTEARVDR